MDEEISNTMNLDLNLGPAPQLASSPAPNESLHRIREAYRVRSRQRWRWRQVQIPAETQNISVIFNQMLVVANAEAGSSPQPGDTAEETTRTREDPNSCDTNNASLVEKKDNASDGSSFFDCNICLDLARDPVVTCCGHLFCWPCLYSWLHLFSDANDCPVCKGEVTMKSVIPIYGHGNSNRESERDSAPGVPQRPRARRVESLRQTIQRAAFNLPVEEVLRRIRARFEPNREMFPTLEPDGDQSQTLLNRILAPGRVRREQSPVVVPAEEADSGGRSNRIVRRMQQLFRTAMPSYEQGQGVGVEDRDSFSSIAAVINSESQMDTNLEIDSTVSPSTSSSRRRNDASRISDVDSGDSRSLRRRRLN